MASELRSDESWIVARQKSGFDLSSLSPKQISVLNGDGGSLILHVTIAHASIEIGFFGVQWNLCGVRYETSALTLQL